MTRHDIITLPNPLLRQKSKRISHVDGEIKQLAADMVSATLDWEATREHEVGAALAAVQIGKNYRLIVIRNDLENKADTSFSVFINPEVVKVEGKIEEELEGCLSVASIYGSVPRHSKVKIKALNLDGKEVRLTVEGFMARVFQHEVDHTNGIVFVDHIEDPDKLFRLEADGHFTKLETSIEG
ncbi:MAG TPA: peptide deformylase [Candidatus Nanoarchaeia archaeon]|nr:peptide deformylase [Candidatus Nanoarchaeia archaeon]